MPIHHRPDHFSPWKLSCRLLRPKPRPALQLRRGSCCYSHSLCGTPACTRPASRSYSMQAVGAAFHSPVAGSGRSCPDPPKYTAASTLPHDQRLFQLQEARRAWWHSSLPCRPGHPCPRRSCCRANGSQRRPASRSKGLCRQQGRGCRPRSSGKSGVATMFVRCSCFSSCLVCFADRQALALTHLLHCSKLSGGRAVAEPAAEACHLKSIKTWGLPQVN